MKGQLLAVVLASHLCAAALHAQCVVVDHAADDWQALNMFWRTNIPICQIAPGNNNAYADRQQGVVWADQGWLDGIAMQFGSWAATGILAHE
ncbi:MAG: hypothetical protein ACREOQ_22180 [Gemmatimonadales bacterium]